MFQYGDNEINSYNSLSMNQTCKPDIKSSKLYSSSKLIITNELSSKYKKNQINSSKKVILDLNNANSNILNLENEENNNNENNLNLNNNNKSEEYDLNDKTKSSKNLTKLPKITKYAIQTNSILESTSNINNPLVSTTNSIDKNINYNPNLYYTKNQHFYNDQFKKKNKSKKRKNSLRLSGTANFESINCQKKPSSDNFNNNLNKKIKFKNEPKLGKMKEYIILPDFIGEEPLTEMIFNPVLQDNLIKPQNEKQYEINLYLNSHKMLNNLIYLKIPLTKDGLIPTQNIINVKKLNKDNKYEEDEEDIIPENKKELNSKIYTKSPSNEENTLILLPKSKPYVSISEYPGNYKPQKKIKNEKELKLSHNIIEKINLNINNNENFEQNNIKSTRGSLNLNLYEISKRYQNNSDIYGDKNSENYVSRSIHMPNGIQFFENKTDKNENSINNNESDINLNEDNKSDNEQIIQLNTIYRDIQPYYKLKNEKDKTLIFESRFESGNLLCAFKTEDENNYQLYLQNDTNTTGYIQWFFFRVSNTKKGNKANFTIINMLRSRCVYKKGLKIMTYSKMQSQKENIGWHRDCENIMYYTNNLYTYNENSKKKRSLNSLTFEYEFKYDNDTVYFANCLPYFYSKLTREIHFYEKNLKKNFYLNKNIITQTLGGNDLFLLHINTSKSQNNIFSELSLPQLNQSCNQPLPNIMNSSSYNFKNIEKENSQKLNNTKKAVILLARQHPGETVGSHVIKGCIDFLLGDSEEAQKLREIYNFQILPMMNPDGVLVGNSRTSFAGCDLNRRWSKPNEIIHPEIFYTKSLILKTSLKDNIAFIIDFHGHFGTYNSLFYCNHKENKKICSLFPYLCSKLSNIISFQQSTFSMPKYKNSTERLTLFRELEDNNNNNIVALETSFFGTNNNNEKNYYFNSKLLNDIGREVCLGMLSYYIKYENINIEKNLNFFNDEEKMKKLDVDMREFESELIREVNEDEDQDGEEELSESEPSIDNFDKKEIMRLMPVYQKKKKKKGKNYNFNYLKKLEKLLNKKKNLEKNCLDKNKNNDLDIELYNPLKELMIKKLEEENKKNLKLIKNPSIKSGSNSSINIKKTKNIQIPNNNNQNKQQTQQNQQQQHQLAATEPNFKSDYTQTEEIFFRMHWTFFVGKFKILTSKRNNNNLPNISTIPLNIGRLNNNYINPFSYSTHKKNDLLVNGKLKNTNWTRFGNIFIDEKKINQIIKQNGNNNNIKVIKGNGVEMNRNSLLKDRSNIRPIYLTRFNGNSLSSTKKANNENKIFNKNSNNKEKEKNLNDYTKVNKGKNNIREENNKEKDNSQA